MRLQLTDMPRALLQQRRLIRISTTLRPLSGVPHHFNPAASRQRSRSLSICRCFALRAGRRICGFLKPDGCAHAKARSDEARQGTHSVSASWRRRSASGCGLVMVSAAAGRAAIAGSDVQGRRPLDRRTSGFEHLAP